MLFFYLLVLCSRILEASEQKPYIISDHFYSQPFILNYRELMDEEGHVYRYDIRTSQFYFLDQYNGNQLKPISLPLTKNCKPSGENYKVTGITRTKEGNTWLRADCFWNNRHMVDRQSILLDKVGNVLVHQFFPNATSSMTPTPENPVFDNRLETQQISATEDGGFYLLAKNQSTMRAYMLRRYDAKGNILWGKYVTGRSDVISMTQTPPHLAKGVMIVGLNNLGTHQKFIFEHYSEKGDLLKVKEVHSNRNFKHGYEEVSFNQFGFATAWTLDEVRHYVNRYTVDGEFLYQRQIPVPEFVLESKKSSSYGGIRFLPHALLPGLDSTTLYGYLLTTYKDNKAKGSRGRVMVYQKDVESPYIKDISTEPNLAEHLCQYGDFQLTQYNPPPSSLRHYVDTTFHSFHFQLFVSLVSPYFCGGDSTGSKIKKMRFETNLTSH